MKGKHLYRSLGEAYPLPHPGWVQSQALAQRAVQDIQYDPREAQFERVPFCQSNEPRINIGHYGPGGNDESIQAENVKWACDNCDGRNYADRCVYLDQNTVRGVCNNMGYYSSSDVGPPPAKLENEQISPMSSEISNMRQLNEKIKNLETQNQNLINENQSLVNKLNSPPPMLFSGRSEGAPIDNSIPN